jgi:hypothetical protein
MKRKVWSEKYECEICGLDSVSALERHHIIPTTDPRSTNQPSNIAVLCGSCHNEVHAGLKIIEGRFSTTAGNILFWHKRNESFHICRGVILLENGLAETLK